MFFLHILLTAWGLRIILSDCPVLAKFISNAILTLPEIPLKLKKSKVWHLCWQNL
jgi:hypothetical protein